jgi:predicted nucleic acid-binding protein
MSLETIIEDYKQAIEHYKAANELLRKSNAELIVACELWEETTSILEEINEIQKKKIQKLEDRLDLGFEPVDYNPE